MDETIDILLATYNGERYLEAQLDSIINQTNKLWKLIVRDDCSEDATLEILNEYAYRYPEKITLLNSNGRRLGSCQSFNVLLEHSAASYILFCDQDDLWFPDKIDTLVAEMRKLENSGYLGKPVLLHSDLKVVDEGLNLISNSFWLYQNLDQEIAQDLYQLAAHNVITGCSMVINNAARNVSIPMSQSALMHDWWIAIKVCNYGIIQKIDRPLMLYRQHQGNVHGARKKNLLYYLKRFGKLSAYVKHLREKNNMIKELGIEMSRTRVVWAHCVIFCKSLMK